MGFVMVVVFVFGLKFVSGVRYDRYFVMVRVIRCGILLWLRVRSVGLGMC